MIPALTATYNGRDWAKLDRMGTRDEMVITRLAVQTTPTYQPAEQYGMI